MTSFTRYRESHRDQQDHIERHVWGEQKYVSKAGSIIKVRGTDTKDEETAVTVVGSGTSFNLKKDHNAEVFLLAGGADTTLKLAMLTIPKDKQRRWKEEHGGVQNPLDNEWSLDFGPKLAHITKKEWAIGKDGEMEITKEKNVYFRLDGEKEHIIDGINIVNKMVKTPQVVSGKKKPPGFKGNEEAEASDDDSGGGGAAAAFDVEEEVTPAVEYPPDPRGVLIGDHSSPIAASMLGSLQFTPRSDLLLGAESKIDLRDGASIQVDGKPLLSAVEDRLAALEARLAALEGTQQMRTGEEEAVCLVKDVGHRRIFWTTQPEACGEYFMCGYPCSIPGLEYVTSDAPYMDPRIYPPVGGGDYRTIKNDEWVRGLILNILNTRARNDRPCPTPAAVYGHWSESFIGEGEWFYIGSTLWNAAEKVYARCQDAVKAIEAAIRADMGKLIAQGIVSAVTVHAVYHRQSHVDVVIDTVTSTGRARIDLSGAFVSESWVWH